MAINQTNFIRMTFLSILSNDRPKRNQDFSIVIKIFETRDFSLGMGCIGNRRNGAPSMTYDDFHINRSIGTSDEMNL